MIDFEIPDKTKKLKETTEKFILEKVTHSVSKLSWRWV